MRALRASFLAVGALALATACNNAQGKEAPAAPASAGAKPGAPARPAGPPLAVQVHEVKLSTMNVTAPATGTLLARESVELVSEVSLRLTRVHMLEGAKVKKGTLLFQLDSSALRATAARLRVQHRLAKTNFERQEKMLAEGIASQESWETARSRMQELEAELRSVSVDVSKTRIVAPFSGTLGLRRVSEGAWVTPNTPLTTLQDTSALKLDFTLPERFATAVKAGGELTFTAAGSGKTHRGKIVAVEPGMEASTRSVLVRGIVEEPGDLAPGAFVNVQVPLSSDEAMLIPSIALVPAVNGHTVFVVREGVARSVVVQLGTRTEDRVQILSGLKPKDRVIVSNLLRLRDGSQVRPLS